MSLTRIPSKGWPTLVIDADTLADAHDRLIKGERWKSVAGRIGCTDTGLKRCLIRAGYEVEIRRIRQGKIGKTRNIVREIDTDISSRYLSTLSLRVSV
jgi:hypothetical protein